MSTPRVSDAWLLPTLEALLAPDDLARLRTLARDSYWDACVRAALATDEQIVAALAARFRLGVADLSLVSPQAVELVSEPLARRYHVVPLAASGTTLSVATADPHDLDCERALAFATGRAVRMLLATPARIAERIEEIYRPESAIDRLLASVAGEAAVAGGPDTALGAGADEDGPVTRLVDRILREAIAARASDVHVEAEESAVAVRYRIDGVLRETMNLPKAVGGPLVSRVKIMARLDIADRLRPQDGRARVTVDGARVDLRISTLPSAHGEKLVVRILDQSATVLSLAALGVATGAGEPFERLLALREGIVLVTGPTGSGKTTTLYAMLRAVQERGVNIVTVEDPVEYRLPGIVQVQVHERAGLTFASALRSILRQDPDVVLIGEIRDRETAEIAVQASLTGHLVFSTLHTIDAASAITRLADLGVEAFKLAAAVKGVIAQRLLRRLCPSCGVADAAEMPVSGQTAEVRRAAGCADCGMTGYRGRVAVHEVLLVGSDVERRIAAREPAERIAEAARGAGMRTLWDAGLAQLAAGRTSRDELLRVLAAPSEEPAPGPGALDRDYLPPPTLAGDGVTELTVGVVDVYVIRPYGEAWRVLVLQRAPGTRCSGAWETVHGRMEPGERPEDAALRELREETGLDVDRLYNVTVQPFYLHSFGTVQLAVVFAAFVREPGDVVLGDEHQRLEWLTVPEALERFVWPREREALQQIRILLGGGDAGPVEDVLRVI